MATVRRKLCEVIHARSSGGARSARRMLARLILSRLTVNRRVGNVPGGADRAVSVTTLAARCSKTSRLVARFGLRWRQLGGHSLPAVPIRRDQTTDWFEVTPNDSVLQSDLRSECFAWCL